MIQIMRSLKNLLKYGTSMHTLNGEMAANLIHHPTSRSENYDSDGTLIPKILIAS